MDRTEIVVFDRRAVRLHRERSAMLPMGSRFLIQEVRRRLIDRLQDIRYNFETVLDLGCGDSDLPAALAEIGRNPTIFSADSAARFARGKARAVVAEEEALPFAIGSIDLAFSALTLHWTNDLPGALLQLRHILKSDGLLLAGLWGGETLRELRESLMMAQLEAQGGAEQRVSPFADVRDSGGLLQRAGFALPVVDSDVLTVTYPNVFQLMHELRGMGETNALIDRRRQGSRRSLFLRAAQIYTERFGLVDGRIPATFQLLTLTAWAPAPSQPRPLRPGSASNRLSDALNVIEHGTEEGPQKF